MVIAVDNLFRGVPALKLACRKLFPSRPLQLPQQVRTAFVVNAVNRLRYVTQVFWTHNSQPGLAAVQVDPAVVNPLHSGFLGVVRRMYQVADSLLLIKLHNGLERSVTLRLRLI